MALAIRHVHQAVGSECTSIDYRSVALAMVGCYLLVDAERLSTATLYDTFGEPHPVFGPHITTFWTALSIE
jgi:hypothetical protein